MYTFGKSSTEKLLTCRNELQVVAQEAIKLVDFSIIHGYRTQEQQDLIYAQGLSKAKYGITFIVTNSETLEIVPPVDLVFAVTLISKSEETSAIPPALRTASFKVLFDKSKDFKLSTVPKFV